MIIVSDPVPFLWTWIWGFGLGLGLENTTYIWLHLDI